MSANLDLNRGLENPKTSKFFKRVIIWTVAIALAIILIVIFNGKHNKVGLTGIETNINDSIKRDSQVVNDNSIKIHTVQGDVVNGNKIVNNGSKEDSTQTKKSK